MKILIDEISNPLVGDLSAIPGYFSQQGSPQITGRWAMRGDTLFIEFSFTKGNIFKSTVTQYISEEFIRLQEPMVFFN